ncbi:MAG: hydrogenase expression/formation protein HypE [Chloroflexota bacterium]|nr:MAG: hydrogenase expression/formation protein HypE [Chloroflexota bacterium]
MGHGSGGKMMADLIRHMFLPLLENEALNQLGDSAVLELEQFPNRLAFSTDSFVVNPLFFPGGNIGELAVYGTVNDLAMTGAQPLFLSAGFILEEGLPMETLGQISSAFSAACKTAKVQVVTGDTKVVNKGHGDGLYINTTGIGLIPDGVDISPEKAREGDGVIVSGTIGDHGMAIMSVREGLEFETRIVSDTAPLHELVETMLAASLEIHCLRDATRGGLAAALNELARSSRIGITFEEGKIPLRPAVKAACEMLGMDPLYVANEGKLVAIVNGEIEEEVLAAMQSHPLGKDAALIGRVVADHPGIVLAKTGIGGSRVVDLPAGELLPRIC